MMTLSLDLFHLLCNKPHRETSSMIPSCYPNVLASFVALLFQPGAQSRASVDRIRMIRAKYSLLKIKALPQQLETFAETSLALPDTSELNHAVQRKGILPPKFPPARRQHLYPYFLGLFPQTLHLVKLPQRRDRAQCIGMLLSWSASCDLYRLYQQ